MNQIIVEKNRINKKVKLLFIFQFYISFIFIIILFFYWLNISRKRKESEYISNIITSNAKLNSIFSSRRDNIYFARIAISKINLDYFIYNNCSEELLKILPCKYSGPELGEYGNICILGHNYFNGRFFSDISKLKNDDEIVLYGFNNDLYKYIVYEKLEVKLEDIKKVIEDEVSENSILTLCTCTTDKDIRLVIKAVLKNIELLNDDY